MLVDEVDSLISGCQGIIDEFNLELYFVSRQRGAFVRCFFITGFRKFMKPGASKQ